MAEGCARVANLTPGVPARVSAQKPEAAALAADTLGAKLKHRRLQKGQRQIDAAQEMRGEPAHGLDWEPGTKSPTVVHCPAIIAYLGYEPWPLPVGIPERLLAERRRRGWTIERSAAATGMDEGIFGRWEKGRAPARLHIALMEAFVG